MNLTEFNNALERHKELLTEERVTSLNMLHQISYAFSKGNVKTLQTMHKKIENEERHGNTTSMLRNYKNVLSTLIYFSENSK